MCCAAELGVVNYSEATPAEAMAKAVSIAQAICANAPLGVRAAKALITDQQNLTLNNAMGTSLERRLPLNQTEDFKAGVEAFKQRAKPHFKGQ
jgi:enoyl-CoA hydratase/carnithine racemase